MIKERSEVRPSNGKTARRKNQKEELMHQPDETRPPQPAEIGAEVEVVKLNTGILNSAGEAYQRPVDLPYVEHLKEHWDWNAARILLVNQRPDGSYWLVDGQHRVLAIRDLWGDIEVWCYLTHVHGPEEEAELYERVSDGHSRLSPVVIFRGRLTRHEPVAVDIDRIAREEGYALALLGKVESEYQLTIPAVLDRIYKKDGAERLRDLLRFAKETWGGQPGFASSHSINGVAKFFEFFRGSPAWDQERIAEILRQFPLAQVVKQGREIHAQYGSHRHIAFAEAMQNQYNKNAPGGKRTKLFRKGEK